MSPIFLANCCGQNYFLTFWEVLEYNVISVRFPQGDLEVASCQLKRSWRKNQIVGIISLKFTPV